MTFDSTKPTVQLLGRWQPWHDGHLALFKRAIEKTGQVVILIRDMPIDKNNPYTGGQVAKRIEMSLSKEGYAYKYDYDIISVPNIVDITYGRDVGYTITQEHLEAEIESISATKIRNANK
jgi:nicotinamide mononucleotide adenylyltransferase